MPEKPLTVATYAAGASLAAITLVYVFAPTYLIDGDSSSISASARKKGVVGLQNPANDCFINSVLQALAGLTDLRVYLIRENHRRHIDEPWVYEEVVEVDPLRKNAPEWKNQGLQGGIVTKGLKDILDALNERPIYKKVISATSFVKVLETAFRQRISRQQQDAQEFLQVVAERLCDEYHAGMRARRAARKKGGVEGEPTSSAPTEGGAVGDGLAGVESNGDTSDDASVPRIEAEVDSTFEDDDEDGFPMEGKYESQIECQACGFKTKPTESTFCTLTLSVPQSSSTSLNACLDGFFKTEYVDDYKCEKCRLMHARDLLEKEMARSNSESFKNATRESIAKLQHAIDTNPEVAPPDVVLPDMRYAPKCRIAKHTRLTDFPKIMAIHLSRSIFETNISQKNSAKVVFPEELPLGGLLSKRKYKLRGTVTHKGSHHSGHYESFRRQDISLPYSTTNTFQPSGVFAKSGNPSPTATPSPAATPRIGAISKSEEPSPGASTPDLVSASSGASSSLHSLDTLPRPSTDTAASTANGRSSHRHSPTSAPKERDSDSISLRSVAASARSTVSRLSHSARNSRQRSPAGKRASAHSTANGTVKPSKMNLAKHKRRKQNDRWWRISDEKIKEAKTSEVLGMQREVYLLFYELEREGPAQSS
ncbi:Uu.00g012610.m01.CDS01 [Anthostomella pinea]|uniref:Ubiquitin carboxyl-terminal hydrolase n=1 Tax=Anthostomella pinea TaxID=933095 RepID=A0AAI8YMX2_9PEZI|nr:Uu.00g012610.m01.CDS01 [Anthostomella pinea]